MSKVESHAQLDNTLILSLSALLTDGISDPIADVTNLMTFAHAVILFDKVMIPVWDMNSPATDKLPSFIASKGIFQDAVDEDFQQRMKDCIEQSLIMGSSSKSLPIQSNRSITSVLSLVHQILSTEGKAWPGVFQKHVNHLEESHSKSVVREIKRIINDYSEDATYISLPIDQKAALTYLWRCLYNVSLSIEKQRPYLHNAYRLPFVNSVYHHIEEQRLTLPLAEKMPSIIETANSQPTVYNVILPSLLGSILRRIDKKEQIIPEILEVRESGKARAFRSYYRELQEKLGEPAASFELESGMQHLISLWSGFVDPMPIPVVITHYDWSGFKLQPIVPPSVFAWAIRLRTRLCRRHLRFAVHLIEHPEYYKQLNSLVTKTFSSESRVSSGRKSRRPQNRRSRVKKKSSTCQGGNV